MRKSSGKKKKESRRRKRVFGAVDIKDYKHFIFFGKRFINLKYEERTYTRHSNRQNSGKFYVYNCQCAKGHVKGGHANLCTVSIQVMVEVVKEVVQGKLKFIENDARLESSGLVLISRIGKQDEKGVIRVNIGEDGVHYGQHIQPPPSTDGNKTVVFSTDGISSNITGKKRRRLRKVSLPSKTIFHLIHPNSGPKYGGTNCEIIVSLTQEDLMSRLPLRIDEFTISFGDEKLKKDGIVIRWVMWEFLEEMKKGIFGNIYSEKVKEIQPGSMVIMVTTPPWKGQEMVDVKIKFGNKEIQIPEKISFRYIPSLEEDSLPKGPKFGGDGSGDEEEEEDDDDWGSGKKDDFDIDRNGFDGDGSDDLFSDDFSLGDGIAYYHNNMGNYYNEMTCFQTPEFFYDIANGKIDALKKNLQESDKNELLKQTDFFGFSAMDVAKSFIRVEIIRLLSGDGNGNDAKEGEETEGEELFPIEGKKFHPEHLKKECFLCKGKDLTIEEEKLTHRCKETEFTKSTEIEVSGTRLHEFRHIVHKVGKEKSHIISGVEERKKFLDHGVCSSPKCAKVVITEENTTLVLKSENIVSFETQN